MSDDDFTRSANSIIANPTFKTMRNEMERILNEMERDGQDLEDFPSQLVKIGVVLQIALSGPAGTIQSLNDLSNQLSGMLNES